MAVYFLMTIDRQAVKIGYSNDPYKRIRSLQTSHHQELVPLLVLKNGTVTDERNLHQYFAPYRLSGEWFKVNNAMMMAIERFKENPNALPTADDLDVIKQAEERAYIEYIREEWEYTQIVEANRIETIDKVLRIIGAITKKKKAKTVGHDDIVHQCIMEGMHKREAEAAIKLVAEEYYIYRGVFLSGNRWKIATPELRFRLIEYHNNHDNNI